MPARIPIEIESVLRGEAERLGVPQNLAIRLAYVESRFSPTAVSSAGARGLLQIMPRPGKKYGLATEADFFDPKKNATAGLLILRKLYSKTGKWWLAVAAYNRGMGWLRRHPDYREWPVELKKYVQEVFGDRKGGAFPLPKVPVETAAGRLLTSR